MVTPVPHGLGESGKLIEYSLWIPTIRDVNGSLYSSFGVVHLITTEFSICSVTSNQESSAILPEKALFVKEYGNRNEQSHYCKGLGKSLIKGFYV